MTALTPTMKALASGRMIDLMAPRAADIDFFEDVAGTLAVLPRFTGHCRDGRRRCWTVGEHCITGADLIFAHTGSARLAALFLLHDAHEAYIGDIATPVARALAACADAEWPHKPGFPAGHFVDSAVRALKIRLDAAIFAAAAVAPPGEEEKRIIANIDRAMLRAEADRIMPAPAVPWTHTLGVDAPVMQGCLTPSGKPDVIAADWLKRLAAWAPTARRAASPADLAIYADARGQTTRRKGARL